MKKIVIDLDGTLTIDDAAVGYPERQPRKDVVERLREYQRDGYHICILTARNMQTYSGNLGLINVRTLPAIIGWLNRHTVPFDEIIVGKPWCGKEGFHVDDRAVRPDEFVRLAPAEITAMLGPPPTRDDAT